MKPDFELVRLLWTKKYPPRKNWAPTPFFLHQSECVWDNFSRRAKTDNPKPKVCEQEMKYIRGRPDIASKVSYFPSGLFAWSRQEEVKKWAMRWSRLELEEQEQGIRRDLGVKTPPPPGSSTWKPLTITVCVCVCVSSIWLLEINIESAPACTSTHTLALYSGINYFIDKNAGGARSMINTWRFPPPLSCDGNVKSQSAP